MHDVVIIGGSYAGLAAALQLARARRSVLIIDEGERRNRFAAHSHGFLTQDGQSPASIAAEGRADVMAYPTIEWKGGRASEARVTDGGFTVKVGQEEYRGKRLILATGVEDELPPIPGLRERWGQTVFFCPYCDGYEFNLGRLGVLSTSPASGHFAIIVSEWAARGAMTFFQNGEATPEPEARAAFDQRAIQVESTSVVGVTGGPPGIDIRLADGRTTTLDGLFLLPRTRLATPFGEQLGCAMEMGALGPVYTTDASKETTIPGVFACGDIALPMPSVSFAVADGVGAGGAAHQSLIFRH